VSISNAYFDRIAQRILAAHPAPDLRGIIVLLPNLHVAQILAQAMLRVAQAPAILLPQMVTLNEWAQSIQLDAPIASESARGALLYQELRKRPWFENANLWSMTQELLQLFDELTFALDSLPQDEAAFASAVARAYESRQNATLQLEARLVFELWHAMQQGEELDAARAYQQRLAKLAAQAQAPLYVLMASEWVAVEKKFLEEYEQHALAKVFELREMKESTPSLSPSHNGGEIGEHSLKFFAATSLEQEARAAAMQVRLWLQQGKQNIAIVAQDRVVARRLRALLERAEVWVEDETGWTFATLSVSTVLDRWLTALQSDFYHHDLLDLLKSPFIFADMSASERKSAVYHLEQLLRQQNVVVGLEAFSTLAANAPILHAPIARLRQAAALLEQGKKKSLSEWLAALRESLRVLSVDEGLQKDEAGQQLLRALETWQQELASDIGRYKFSEWRRWLAQQLDTQTYRDSSVNSPVRFTHLAATRWRIFDAVLLLGCDAEHLPSASNGGRWFNDAVRSVLNLPTRAVHAIRQRDDLHGVLALNDCVLATWQRDKNGESRLLSPYLQMLRDEYQQTKCEDSAEQELNTYLFAEDAQSITLTASTQPAPSVATPAVPVSVSISAYNSLVACPYQFYARYILRLNPLDEVQEDIEKRDFGERVHEILHRFHEKYAQVRGHDLDEMEAALRRISADVFDDLLQHDFAARAWLLRWYQSLPAYLAWQLEGEAEGWRYAEAETKFDWPLDGVNLRGRIDRLDVRGDEKRVLDYKTQSDIVLRNKLKEPGEDVQLACYAYAHEAAEVAFVSIENGKVKSVAPKEDASLLAQLNVERLEQVMGALREGAGLAANGIAAVCAYCEVRGVCRKGEWAQRESPFPTLPPKGEGLNFPPSLGEGLKEGVNL
jgi:ATP-dependent helicase/nuclease subunit B